MLTHHQIEKAIASILSDITHKPEGEFTSDTRMDSLDIESLDWVEISCTIEAEFNIAVKDEEMESLVTVGDIVGLVEKTIAAS